MNHLMREFTNKSSSTPDYTNASGFGIVEEKDNKDKPFADNIREQMIKLAPRDVIEQIIFDPQHGIVKREIHFGIIDYLTSYPMKKRLDELAQLNQTGTASVQNQAVRPSVYSERFLTTMRKIFE